MPDYLPWRALGLHSKHPPTELIHTSSVGAEGGPPPRAPGSGCFGIGGVSMKSRVRHVQPRASIGPVDEQVRSEIQSFLQALVLYPKTFAKNPEITFEQCLGTLLAVRESDRSHPD